MSGCMQSVVVLPVDVFQCQTSVYRDILWTRGLEFRMYKIAENYHMIGYQHFSTPSGAVRIYPASLISPPITFDARCVKWYPWRRCENWRLFKLFFIEYLKKLIKLNFYRIVSTYLITSLVHKLESMNRKIVKNSNNRQMKNCSIKISFIQISTFDIRNSWSSSHSYLTWCGDAQTFYFET